MTIKNFLITDFSDYVLLFKNINLFKKNSVDKQVKFLDKKNFKKCKY